MKYIGLIFAILGIGLHVRMLGWIIDPTIRKPFVIQWELAPLENRILVVASLVIPFAFYAICIWTCLVNRRSRRLTLLVVVIGLLAIAYFTHLYETLPTVAKNSAWTAFFSIIPYFLRGRAKPATVQPDCAEPS